MKMIYQDKSFYFSTTEAARDLQSLIRATKENKQVVVYGVSYGSFWASRLMQLDEQEHLVDGVFLDGVVAQAGPNRLTFDQWDPKMNQVGMKLLTLCSKDKLCSSKLGQNAGEVVEAVFRKLYHDGKCKFASERVDAYTLRRILGNMLKSQYERELIPALLYRLNRCDDDIDFGVLDYFFKHYSLSEKLNCVPLFGHMLKYNVDLAELWNADVTLEQLETMFNSSYFATGQFDKLQLYQVFKQQNAIYTPDPLYFNKTFTTTTASVVLINGELDPQTTIESAQAQYDNIVAPEGMKHLFAIPYAPHVAVYTSPVNHSQVSCGMQILISYLQDIHAAPDTSCLNLLDPIDFASSNVNVSLSLFGVEEIYEAFYEPASVEPMVNLWTLIGVEAGTLLFFGCILLLLIWHVIELKRAQRNAPPINRQPDEPYY
jgi:hypothetical protein